MNAIPTHSMIDAAAHPVCPTGEEIRRYLPKAWRERSFPGPERYQYASPLGEYRADLATASSLPGSDPVQLKRDLVEEHSISQIVLLPLTRGLLANVDLSSVICAATNDWLADTWLAEEHHDLPFRGSIRINPADADAAVAEIERWADDPRFVQVAVPLQAHHPYGQRMYLRIWEAAAEANLPVAIHVDGGASVDFHPTPAGPLRYALEYSVLLPLNLSYHLASLVAEGVFERIPGLRVVCADGGISAMTPIIWRLDKDWRSTREEIPWTTRFPSDYIAEHVRFCLHQADLPRQSPEQSGWWEVTDAARLALYSSNYPQRDFLAPKAATAGIDEEASRRILFENAAELYNLKPVAQLGGTE